jgi:hypothetical protein
MNCLVIVTEQMSFAVVITIVEWKLCYLPNSICGVVSTCRVVSSHEMRFSTIE